MDNRRQRDPVLQEKRGVLQSFFAFIKRLFVKEDKKLSVLEEEALQTPAKTVIKNFFRHKLGILGLLGFIAILTEHYAGAFPCWLSPVQVKILTITEKQNSYALDVRNKLGEKGIRVETDLRNEKIGYKIREARMEKVPYMLVIGDKETESGQVAVRSRKEGDLGPMPLDAFINRISEEIASMA